MPNSIGVLDQLAPSTTKPNLFIKRKEAIFLIATKQAVWIEPEVLLRKTPRYKRLTADSIIQKETEKHKIGWRACPSGNLLGGISLPRGASGLRGATVMQLV